MVITSERLRWVEERLIEVGVDSVAFEARQLLNAAEDEAQLENWLSRRQKGEPLQYLLGEWEFWGLPFEVGEGVLIPQPDTEILVEQSLAAVKDKTAPTILDLCAGSGCVAIALAHELPNARVTAVELYDSAFSYLERNIKLNSVKVTAVKADVLSAPPEKLQGEYDLIVSNPPYIAFDERGKLSAEVLFEPEQALFADQNGLAFYRAIAEHWLPLLKEGGTLAVEIGYRQAEAVRGVFSDYDTEVHTDYGGNDRVITLVKKSI